MDDRRLQIGICGTFDVENYGDLLFPLIAERELIQRLDSVKLYRFSYRHKTTPDWPYEVTSLVDLPEVARSLDGLIIGGGHIIRFDKHVAYGYRPPSPLIHHPTGYWLMPALLSIQHSVPVLWNAPGVHGEIPAWAEPLVQLALKESSYISVRDSASQQALSRFVEESSIKVIPDTAFGLANLLCHQQPSPDFSRLSEALKLGDRYIVVQATAGLDAFSRLIQNHPDRFRDYKIVVVKIGPILGDREELFGNNLPNRVRLVSWPEPLLLAELIGRASAAVCISLHMSITALASGVPVFRPSKYFDGKYAELSAFDTVESFDNESEIDIEWFSAKAGRTEPSPKVRSALSHLSDHWDRIAAILANAHQKPLTHGALDSFWQSLPEILESWSNRERAAILKRDAAIAERDQIASGNTSDERFNDSDNRKTASPLRSFGRWLRGQKRVEDES